MSQGLVIGTAGHIDHGKTTLIKALTGIDTDRLAEEKRRGISIDLGFAQATLPGGIRLSFIDVPGHERFVRNMLAGAAGIEAVMLTIAADEGVKPQTREHFAICRLLGIRRGLIVLTKSDLATAEQSAKTLADVRTLTAGSFLEDAAAVMVSSTTGQGLDELKKQLALLAKESSNRNASDAVRLPIDRSFALKGFGTVVTGTLWSGTLRVGDVVQIHPSNASARVRGLQRHNDAVEMARAGDRTAVNLAGIDHSEIKRGFVLTLPDSVDDSRTLDVGLEWLDKESVSSKPMEVLLNIGTAEETARLKVFEASGHFARLSVSESVVAMPGDRFVLRRPSPTTTIAGGIVIDAFPMKRLNRAATLERLKKLERATAAERVRFLTAESAEGVPLVQIARQTGLPGETIAQLPELVVINGQHVVTKEWIEERRKKLVEWLRDFHSKQPAAAGAPVAQARLGLDSAMMTAITENFAAVKVQGDVVALASHQARLSEGESTALKRIEEAFRQGAFQPPAPAEVLAASGADAKTARGLLETLIKEKKLVRVSADIIFHADVILHIRKSLAAHRGRRFSVPEFKTWTNISRKYAIPLLEYLDQQRVTRRDGDSRVVL